MHRSIRRCLSHAALTFAAVALLGAGRGTALAGGGADLAVPVPIGPVLTLALSRDPGEVEVAGAGFAPGVRVYVGLYDVTGTTLLGGGWTTASSSVYGRDGSAAHTLGGAIAARIGCVGSVAARAKVYDAATGRWTRWLAVAPASGLGRSPSATTTASAFPPSAPAHPAIDPWNPLGSIGGRSAAPER